MSNLEIFEKNLAILSRDSKIKDLFSPSDTYFDQISGPLFRYIFSYQSRVVGANSFHKYNIEPEKNIQLQTKSPESNDNMENYLKTITEETTTFSVSGLNGNANIPSFKQKTYGSLTYLDFSNSKIISNSVFRYAMALKSLTHLCLFNCGLFSIPQELYKPIHSLKTLDLSSNYISTIPHEIQWDKIQGLNVSLNSFDGWPTNLNNSKMPNLEYLSISNNKIKDNFGSISKGGCFSKLQYLDMSFCELLILPKVFTQCRALTYFSLSGNMNLVLPDLDFFEDSTLLQFLNISGVSFGVSLNNLPKTAKFPPSIEVIVARQKTYEYIPKGNYTIIHD